MREFHLYYPPPLFMDQSQIDQENQKKTGNNPYQNKPKYDPKNTQPSEGDEPESDVK